MERELNSYRAMWRVSLAASMALTMRASTATLGRTPEPDSTSFCGITCIMTAFCSLTMCGRTRSWKPIFTGELPASLTVTVTLPVESDWLEISA